MALPPDRYLEQTVLRQMLNGMLEAVCRERPSSLCAHLFDYLHRSYPDDAAALEGLERKAEALGGWQSRNDIGSSQAALIEFIETTSVRQILETILEAALREQPDNVVVFFMEQLFCTAANEVPPTVPTEADQPAVTTTVEEEKDVAVAGVEPSPPEFPAVDAEASASASSDVVSGAAAEAVLDATVGGVEGGVEGTLLAGSAPEVDDAVARLFKAVEASDAAEVEAALASGASVTSINAAGQTALHLAAEGEPHVVGVLVSCADCPLDALDAEGRTALMLAIAYHDGESVAKLVGAGASVDVEDREGKNATAYAEDSGDAAIIKAVTGKDVEAKEHVPPPPASRSMSKRSSFTSGSVDPATIDRASIPIVEKSEEVQVCAGSWTQFVSSSNLSRPGPLYLFLTRVSFAIGIHSRCCPRKHSLQQSR